ncbi:MAG: GTPase ObgE, partial [Bacteroidota bacterium]
LAITKKDLLDDEMIGWLQEELPEDIPTVFISSVAQQGLVELKDLIWETINN